MTIAFETRLSDVPYIESITKGQTLSAGNPLRPAEINWHMVLASHQNNLHFMLVGPWTNAGYVHYGADAEVLWIKLKLGAFMPHWVTRKLLNSETALPQAAAKRSFWLKSSAWQVPNFENVETFLQRLIHEEILVYDPIVASALSNDRYVKTLSPRTVRHRFLQATGLSQNHIYQVKRAQAAQELLATGTPILDTMTTLGYYDQAHLTRSLKQFIGYTPSQVQQWHHAT